MCWYSDIVGPYHLVKNIGRRWREGRREVRAAGKVLDPLPAMLKCQQTETRRHYRGNEGQVVLFTHESLLALFSRHITHIHVHIHVYKMYPYMYTCSLTVSDSVSQFVLVNIICVYMPLCTYQSTVIIMYMYMYTYC